MEFNLYQFLTFVLFYWYEATHISLRRLSFKIQKLVVSNATTTHAYIHFYVIIKDSCIIGVEPFVCGSISLYIYCWCIELKTQSDLMIRYQLQTNHLNGH